MFKRIVERPIAVLMLSLAASLFGILAYQQLRVSLMPPLSYPSLTILTSYPGAAPEEVEIEITSPLESRLSTLEGLVSMRSRSLSAQSEITLSLQWETQLDQALQRVYERLDRVELPEGSTAPQVLRYDPNLDPLMVLSLSSTRSTIGEFNSISSRQSLAKMKRYALEVLTPSLYQIEGVAAVKVSGGDEPMIEVSVHLDSLQRYSLTIDDVSSSLSAAQVNQAGGLLQTERGSVLIRTLSELKSIEELKSLVIKRVTPDMNDPSKDLTPKSEETGGVTLIRLSDIADVNHAFQERTSWVQLDQSPAVRVQIYRQSESDLVSVSRRIRHFIFQKLSAADSSEEGHEEQKTESVTIPIMNGLKLSLITDQASFIERALAEVNQAIVFGALLAILILYAFLSSWAQTFVIAVAMPLSVIFAFIPLQVFGVSLNLMSLGGLALGVGMLVDNAVVVLESISRRQEQGDEPNLAAERGVSEVGSAVFASTLTTVAVFAPVAFIEGLAGQVFRDLAFTVVSALLASLCVALFIVPTLAARLMKSSSVEDGGDLEPTPPRLRVNLWPVWWSKWTQPGVRNKFSALLLLPLMSIEGSLSLVAVIVLLTIRTLFQLLRVVIQPLVKVLALPLALVSRLTTRFYDFGCQLYLDSLERTMRYPIVTSVFALTLLWLSYTVQTGIPRSLLPEVSQGVLIAELNYPVGTSLEGTKKRIDWWLSQLTSRPVVERVDVMIGQDQSNEQPGERRGPHQARLTVTLSEPQYEPRLREEMWRLSKRAPGAKLKLSRPSLIHSESPLRIVAKSQSLSELEEAEDRLVTVLESHPKLTNVERTFGQGAPELKLKYDHEKLRRLGLTPKQIANQVKGQLTGLKALELIWDGERLPLQVRSVYAEQVKRDELLSLPIKMNQVSDEMIPLGAFAHLVASEGPAEIRHVDGQRAAELTAKVSAFDLAEVARVISRRIDRMPLPPGVETESLGQERELHQSASALSEVLLLSLFLVFVVMATQFESLRAPLFIMGSVPLALIGVVFGLWLTGTSMSVVVFVGMITLGGVVVNNAIVFIDAAKNAQEFSPELSNQELMRLAGERRLRPILMTTLTTLLGLAPMLSSQGEGAELRVPLALTLMFGLACSTILILYVLPSIYLLFMPQRFSFEAGSDLS